MRQKPFHPFAPVMPANQTVIPSASDHFCIIFSKKLLPSISSYDPVFDSYRRKK